MKAFEFDRHLIENYERFSRSFSNIRAADLREAISRQYEEGRFWPDALISLNPLYERGPSIDDLASKGEIDPDTAKIFRIGSEPLKLHRHQGQAVAKARAGKSFVVTTGTGSGKSLCFFIPIVDAVIRARKAGAEPRTRAIIVYPMNALANSQVKEIDKFIEQAGLPDHLKPEVKRYTGQESKEDRQKIANNPPDILLTNFMMAELLLTRQDSIDSQVIANATGLQFIVLDELHTYRGRQGADVAILVRRLRDRCTPDADPICIGTSATMASEGNDSDRASSVSEVATKLFGITLDRESVIDETLKRATTDKLNLSDVVPDLPEILKNDIPESLTDAELRSHPLAVWAEMALGLEDGQALKRRVPTPFGLAAERLAKDSGAEVSLCASTLEAFLTRVSLPEKSRGGTGEHAFLAFKLHRFVAGAGEFYTTLTAPPRTVLLEGQLEDPYNPGTRLYPTRFCRQCGQEYHVVTRTDRNDGSLFLPRNIDDTPADGEDDEEVAGYLTPTEPDGDEYRFDGSVESYPETWTEDRNGLLKLRTNRKNRIPTLTTVASNGRLTADGRPFWFIPGKFGFCPRCLDEPQPNMRERSKLAGLSAEGRSSATTLLVSSALEWLNQAGNSVPEDKRKLLGFTDNRQDAALQAGHFNDFLFVSVLRGAILRAVLDAGTVGLRDDEFGNHVRRALGFTSSNAALRKYWMLQPEAGAVYRDEAERALAKVLAHRVLTDLRRGWRFTNPNLTELKLIEVDYLGLDDVAADQERLAVVLPELAALSQESRRVAIKILLDAMREGLAVGSESLASSEIDSFAQNSRNSLRAPWAIDAKESPHYRSTLYLSPPSKKQTKLSEEQLILRAGPSSRIARALNKVSVIGVKLPRDHYLDFLEKLLDLLTSEGVVRQVAGDGDTKGWQLSPAAVRLIPGKASRTGTSLGNPYFHDLYSRIAADLATGATSLFGMEGREHTAQVTQTKREWREWRFRYESDDQENIIKAAADIKADGESDQFLPALFCSPTMELGVDISALNTVYLRNVPPTPANYAQRAGRAGRSGQAAVIVTYCAAQSPHDQYFFDRRNDMVAGVVRPPALDITNQELVTSHLHAVWLAETKLVLAPDIPEILDLERPDYPLKAEIKAVIEDPGLVARASAPMGRVLNQVLVTLGSKPTWMGAPDEFVREVATNAPTEFDKAFDRWRELYDSARSQLREANRRSLITGLTSKERRATKASQAQATDQIAILEQGKATNGSDFYTYRYLATEGFLPGYNFPRLPLYAFIPGEGSSGSYLQRARFLAISEFGPRSLIYHEGRAYRVTKAKLPPEVRSTDGQELATREIFICPNCGGAHEEERERCHACDSPMAGEIPVKRTLRIDNVEAAPAERITANDEERVRQGFDIQTVFSWPIKHGLPEVISAEFQVGGETLLCLQYANSAEISRINKGLKRRRDQTVLGFMIDPQSGYWAKADNDPPDANDPPDIPRPVRIVPIVRDNKNALLLRFANPDSYDPETIVTVQHALLRGIEIAFQLEEGEILGEPLPSRDSRRAILIYEATEGGAGVLSRLIDDPDAFNRVARKALELMHFEKVDDAIAAGDPGILRDHEEDACVLGCYKCLLSYYNQPDQEMIDRTSDQVKQFLIDLARGTLASASSATGSSAEQAWRDYFSQEGLPPPDTKGTTFSGTSVTFAWRGHFVAASIGDIPEAARGEAESKSWTLFELPENPESGPPAELIASLRG